MGEHFCFVLDGIDFKGKLPFEVIPGHWFRKATTEEIQHIKRELHARGIGGIEFFRYEHKSVPTKKAKLHGSPSLYNLKGGDTTLYHLMVLMIRSGI